MLVKANLWSSHKPKFFPPPVPLILREDDTRRKIKGSVETQKLKLRINPQDDDSDTYGFEIKTIDNPDAEEYITWWKKMDVVARQVPTRKARAN